MNSRNPKVEFYFAKSKGWQEELEYLRTFVLDCGLTEELKWGVPCYTSENRNILLLHVFKDYCAILFFKGALLKDSQGILIQQTKNTQATRQIRFTSVQQIVEMKPTIKAYIQEAIEIENSGLQVDFKKTTGFTIPEEFEDKLNEFPALKTAFNELTPGRQRAYLLYFSTPKQAKTRAARIEKSMPQILSGKGLLE